MSDGGFQMAAWTSARRAFNALPGYEGAARQAVERLASVYLNRAFGIDCRAGRLQPSAGNHVRVIQSGH